jgi:hypothetical protein
MTSLFQGRSSSQSQSSYLFAFVVTTIFVLTTTTSSLKVVQVDATRNAHFTMEFIPTFKNGLPHKCHPDEIKIMETFLGDILVKETGMIEHSVEYLDKMYDPNDKSSGTEPGSAANHMKRHHFSKVRGFDFTFDCPIQGEKCPDNDWCHVLCLDESVKPGHVSLTEKATQLKEKLHTHAKTLEGPYNVKCLGQTSDLDFHLLVSVSP